MEKEEEPLAYTVCNKQSFKQSSKRYAGFRLYIPKKKYVTIVL